jgi:hypothetical protein
MILRPARAVRCTDMSFKNLTPRIAVDADLPVTPPDAAVDANFPVPVAPAMQPRPVYPKKPR